MLLCGGQVGCNWQQGQKLDDSIIHAWIRRWEAWAWAAQLLNAGGGSGAAGLCTYVWFSKIYINHVFSKIEYTELKTTN